MTPVVLVHRTPNADAFEYKRYAGKEVTHHARLEPVKVGVPLETLSRQDVEILRTNPERFFQ